MGGRNDRWFGSRFARLPVGSILYEYALNCMLIHAHIRDPVWFKNWIHAAPR
jgi:hypothetical protein